MISLRVLLGLSLLLGATSVSAMPTYTGLVVFGDSLSDNGNLLAVTGNIPDPNYYDQGRFQNGLAYAERLWEGLGLPGNLQPRIYAPAPPQGTNYAVGGARSRYFVGDLHPMTQLPPALGSTPTAFSLLGQVGFHLGDLQGADADPDALYAVWAGANDITDVVNVSVQLDSVTADDYLDQAVGDFDNAFGALIGAGARNLLVLNIPDIGTTPEILSIDQNIPGYAAAATAYTMAYNDAIDIVLTDFVGLPGLEIVRFDSFSLLQQAVEKPSSLGFSNAVDPCLENVFVVPPPPGTQVDTCPNPDDYVFWDAFHPSAQAHRVIAASMLEQIPVPASLPLLAFGLIVLAGYRRMHRRPF